MGVSKLCHLDLVLSLVLVHTVQSFIVDLLQPGLILTIQLLLCLGPLLAILGVKCLLVALPVIIYAFQAAASRRIPT